MLEINTTGDGGTQACGEAGAYSYYEDGGNAQARRASANYR